MSEEKKTAQATTVEYCQYASEKNARKTTGTDKKLQPFVKT